MKLILPRRPDHEALLGFLISAASAAGGSFGILSAVLGGFSPLVSLVVGMAAGGGVILAGLRRERIVNRAYRTWNRAAAAYARRATGAVTGLWYWTVFSAVALTGERTRLEVGQSPWRKRDTLPASAYGSPAGIVTGRGKPGAVRDFVRWAARSGRYWSLTLLPLFWVLKVLDAGDGNAVTSANIYTLY